MGVSQSSDPLEHAANAEQLLFEEFALLCFVWIMLPPGFSVLLRYWDLYLGRQSFPVPALQWLANVCLRSLAPFPGRAGVTRGGTENRRMFPGPGQEPVSQVAPAQTPLRLWEQPWPGCRLQPSIPCTNTGVGRLIPSCGGRWVTVGAGGDVSVNEINLQFGQVCW